MQKVTNYLSKYNSTEFVETDEMKFGSFHRFIQAGNYALVTGIYQKHFGENVHFVDGLNLLRQGSHIIRGLFSLNPMNCTDHCISTDH